jgi:hypothetical protein
LKIEETRFSGPTETRFFANRVSNPTIKTNFYKQKHLRNLVSQRNLVSGGRINLIRNPVFSQQSKPGFFPTGFLAPLKPGFLPTVETRFFANRVSGPTETRFFPNGRNPVFPQPGFWRSKPGFFPTGFLISCYNPT